jgi:DNA-binding MarR family transcriptional regulator
VQNTALSTASQQSDLVHTIVSLNADLRRLMLSDDSDAWMDLQHVTLKQLKVMLLLSRHKQETVTTLAKQLDVHISTVTGILDRLVQQQLVRREEDPSDRRHVISRLTPEGENVLRRLYGAGERDLAGRLEHLSADDLHALERGLRALVSNW